MNCLWRKLNHESKCMWISSKDIQCRQNIWGLEDCSSPYFGRLFNPISTRGDYRLCPLYMLVLNKILNIPAALICILTLTLSYRFRWCKNTCCKSCIILVTFEFNSMQNMKWKYDWYFQWQFFETFMIFDGLLLFCIHNLFPKPIEQCIIKRIDSWSWFKERKSYEKKRLVARLL